MLSFKDDGVNNRTIEVTLEEMCNAAHEVDGTGTVDVSSSAAERLKHNQATSTTEENGERQVTEQTSTTSVLPRDSF